MFVPDILVIIVTWVKISIKSVCNEEEVAQLRNLSWCFGRYADVYKVLVVNFSFSCKFQL